jgi:SAM-dependent methyltransferase
MSSRTESDFALTAALLRLADWLVGVGYRFTTVTPATHGRVNARASNQVARNLRDIFGWSRPFAPALLAQLPLETLRAAGLLLPAPDGLVRSAVRYSSLNGQLFAHSAYPTVEDDAVFFGPDTCRFVQLIEDELRREPLPADARILDLGCGSGAGGIAAALAATTARPRLVLSDINPRALRFAAANAAHAQCGEAELIESDLYAAVDGQFDLIVANPPYLNDTSERTYRHGGGSFGEALSERIVREGLPRLAAGGRLVLYTGATIVDGTDTLFEILRPQLGDWPWRYREIDPDVFGEELDEPAYADAERIAAVALVVHRPPR